MSDITAPTDTAPEVATATLGAEPAPPPLAPVEDEDTPIEVRGRPFSAPPRFPLLGPSLLTFGTLLWAYVTFGDLVVVAGFPEFLATLIVLAVFLRSAYASGRQSLALSPAPPELRQRRLVTPGAYALGAAFSTVLFVSGLAGTSRMSVDSLITLFLLGLSLVTGLTGRRLSGPLPRPPNASLRALSLGLRIVGALFTFFVVARTLTRL